MTAIERALNKRLIFDIMRQTKNLASICSCDLQGCYNMILHNFASIAMQCCGAPRSTIHSMFTTIQTLKHIVRTVFGDSESSFRGIFRENLPNSMVFVRVMKLDLLCGQSLALFYLVIYVNVIVLEYLYLFLKLDFHLVGCDFVDDTDIIQTCGDMDDYHQVSSKFQEAIGLWETGSRASGGTLVPDKSWYSLIDFD